jgi:predicted dehydrogenase
VVVRFGLFGTGPWAHLAHAPGLAAHPEVEFVGVWGRNEAKAADLAGHYGAKPYADADALIADVDAIAVALPPAVQAPIALRAAQAGKHLLLDKPVALDPDEADRIADAADAHGVHSVVFFTRRLMPVVREFLSEAVTTGGWIESRVDHVGNIYADGGPFADSPWRIEAGGLWDVGPHALATILPVLGPVTEVTAFAGPYDMTHVLLRHESDAISTLELSIAAPPAAAREDVVFAGSAGRVSVPDQPFEPVEAIGAALDALFAGSSELDVRFGASVTRVLAAIASAITTRTVVAVPARP